MVTPQPDQSVEACRRPPGKPGRIPNPGPLRDSPQMSSAGKSVLLQNRFQLKSGSCLIIHSTSPDPRFHDPRFSTAKKLTKDADAPGLSIERIAFDEIHPEFLDTLDQTSVPTVTGVKKVLYLGLAALFFVLGALGVALPVLPTTPFLLLTSYFLIRTSPRLNRVLLQSPVLGQVLKEWQQAGGVRLSVKIQAISIVLTIILVTLIFSTLSITLKTVLVVLACIGILVVIRLPRLT